MSAVSNNPYNPGSNFEPTAPPNNDLPELEARYQQDLAQLQQLQETDPCAVINFFYGEMMPIKSEIESAQIDLFSYQVNDMTNYSNYTAMLKTEFDQSNPAEQGYKDWTSTFISQVPALIDAINQDPNLTKENKSNLTDPLTTMLNLAQSKTFTQIWNESSPSSSGSGTTPSPINGQDMQTMLTSFDSIATSTQSFSQTFQTEMQYEMNLYKQDFNSTKSSYDTLTKSNSSIISGYLTN
jgi:hypothetical protein